MLVAQRLGQGSDLRLELRRFDGVPVGELAGRIGSSVEARRAKSANRSASMRERQPMNSAIS